MSDLDLREDLEDDEDTLKDRFLTFRLGEEQYGIEIRHVTEIVGIQRITEVPDMPASIKGVINLRGQVIPVMDVRLRFRLPPREYDERTCIVVVALAEISVGLIVDQVEEVREIPAGNVSPPMHVGQTAAGRCVQGLGRVGEEVKILLDVSKLVCEQELAAVVSST